MPDASPNLASTSVELKAAAGFGFDHATPYSTAPDVEQMVRSLSSAALADVLVKRLYLMAENCPAMVWMTNAEGALEFASKTARAFCARQDDELNLSSCKLFYQPESAPNYAAAFQRARQERTPFSAEARVQRPDGRWRYIGSKAEPCISAEGEYLGHIGITADITERHGTERARQFEISLLHAIQNESVEGILAVNDAGFIVSYNKRFLEIWGISSAMAPEQLLDEAVGALDHPFLLSAVENSEAFLERVQKLHDHPDDEEHCEIRLRDGRTLELRSAGLRATEGTYLGRVWFFRDITAQRQAEIGLQKAKASAEQANRRLLAERTVLDNERRMLRGLIDNIPDFMYVKDTQSRFIVANHYLARMVGLQSAQELIGKSDFDFFPAKLAQGFFEDEQKLIQSGEPLYNQEESGLDDNGRPLRVLTTKVPLKDNSGRVTGLAGVGRDITDRKRAEDALREAEQKYRGIFDNAIIGIFQSTPEGRFLSVNTSMAATFGYESPEDMIERITNIAEQFYADPKQRQEFMSKLAQNGEVQNFECEAVCKDGRRVWLSMSVRAIFQGGEVVRYEGMCENITERKLLREQLFQAQKLESVGQLAAGIAHEINTPTQYIGDNVRFLQDAFSDLKELLNRYEQLLHATNFQKGVCEELQSISEVVQRVDAPYLLEEIPRAIEQTLEGVNRVATLVGAMKEFSHPGAKEKTPTDLNHAIESTITVARNEWKYVADMETSFDASLPPVPCLPGEFNQVILNLIVNSAHAIADVIEDGGPAKGKIRIQTRNCAPWAEIRVEDTGAGIPESIRTRIFDPFFTTKEIGKGTGQGLAIARSVIVDKHGGSIDFETEAGKGTTFIIRLPQVGNV